MPLFDTILKPTLDSVGALVSQFHLSPEDKAKAEQILAATQAQAQADARNYELQLNSIAGENIRADAQSGDKYTERARPSFMYLIMAVLAFNYIGIPAAELFGSKVQPIALPGDLLTLFGICVTGYAMSRTAEKIAGLPGDSQISVLGMKVGNKQ